MPDGGNIRGGGELFTAPNIISFGRLCAVPFAIWLVLHRHFGAAFGLFVAAGVSDAVDGWLARRQGGSALGAVLDPLADKVLMIGMDVTLAATVFRDLVIVGGVMLLWMTSHGVQIKPLEVSKANTALQIGLVAVVLGLDSLGVALWPVRTALVWLVAGSTLLSGAAYVRRTVR